MAASLLIMTGWSLIVGKFYPKAAIPAAQVIPVKTTSSQPAISLPPPAPASTHPSQEIAIENNQVKLIFDEAEAAIKGAVFKQYQNYAYNTINGLKLGVPILFAKDALTDNKIVFGGKTENLQINKVFTFNDSSYLGRLDIVIKNMSNLKYSQPIELALGTIDFAANQEESRYKDVTVFTPDKIVHANGRKSTSFDKVKFISIRDRYFAAIVEPESGNMKGYIKKIDKNKSEAGVIIDATLEEGQSAQFGFYIYLGPQDLQYINEHNTDWSAIMYHGTFDFISQLLLQLLNFIYKFAHNWGIAIIVLTLIVYIVSFPLSLKQMRSMKEMQHLQPKVEELRKAYKDNPQKFNKEVMELYREHKVNPIGGCLPMILQIPIFFALYQALIRCIALKGASFLWIKDLSKPDSLFTLPVAIPVIGNEINILPILMTAEMFVQQRMTTAATAGGSAEQQKIMMIVFPLMFGFIFYHMPAALVLYWFVNSTLMLIYQLRVSRSK